MRVGRRFLGLLPKECHFMRDVMLYFRTERSYLSVLFVFDLQEVIRTLTMVITGAPTLRYRFLTALIDTPKC